MTNEGGKTCPVCTEEMDMTDLQLKPCKCGYEVCVWCWHNIINMAEKDGTEGRCPACRTPYDKEKIVQASVEISSERKLKPQKSKSRTQDGRKHLSNVRVVQRHLVYTMGIPATLADEEVLQRKEYFGQYGKVLKTSLTRTSGGAIQYSPNNTCSVYITYSKEDEAVRCIQSVHGYILQGQPLRACFGTTKYCHAWLRNMPCSNPDCVYLHDVGNQEDSFTKDEIVSAYTRSRVQQITGATNNLERRSGNMLPPPMDEPYTTGTALSKPVSRSPSDNPSSQLKFSPPNSSSGRSISLPAAASWGLRVSNGHPPPATPVYSNVPSKQKHEDTNGTVGFPSLVASTIPASILQTDVGKKSWVIKEGRSIQSSREIGSSEYSKDRQNMIPDTPGEVLQDPIVATSCWASSNDQDGTQKSPNMACSLETDRHQSHVAILNKDGNGNVDENVQRSGLSSLCIESCLSNDGLHHSYLEHAKGHLASLPPTKAVTSDDLFASRELSDWDSESQTHVLQDNGTLEDELLALGEQNSNFSEVRHPSHLSSRSSSINIPSSSNGHSWPYDQARGASDQISRDLPSMHVKTDEAVLPFTSRDSVVSNEYMQNNGSASTGLEILYEQSNLLSSVEKGKYSRGTNSNQVEFEKNTSADLGEKEIISDILSLDFDPWGESLASPQNLGILSDKLRSSWKEPKSNQSRFSFARQVDCADQGADSDLFRNIGKTQLASQVFQDNRNIHPNEPQSGLSGNYMEETDTHYGGNLNTSSNRYSGPRTPVSAPPGFSAPSKIPPPGFSVQERTDKAFDGSTANHFLGSSSFSRNQYTVRPMSEVTSIGDVELIDPAILAVGTGRPANGINDYCLDIRSTPTLQQLSASENDPRFQLLRQQFLSQQSNVRYSEHVGDRFSSLTDAYNAPSRFLDQSQFAQLSIQPRNESFTHGWNSWNETQNGNNLGMAELYKNERYGYNQYYPDYDNRSSRMPRQNDLYNKAFGI